MAVKTIAELDVTFRTDDPTLDKLLHQNFVVLRDQAKPQVALFPTFNANWGNYGGGFRVANYRLQQGIVFLDGLIVRTGAAGVGEAAFTLPAGYRPVASCPFPVMRSGDAIGRVDVAATGDVILVSGDASSYLSLSGICFPIT